MRRWIPFTNYGTDIRMKSIAHLSEDLITAFVLCHKTLRKRNLEEKYPNVLTHSPKRRKTEQETEITTPKTTPKTAEKIIGLMRANPKITIEMLCQEC